MSIVKIYDKADGDDFQVKASREYLEKLNVGSIAVICLFPVTVVTMCKSYLEVTHRRNLTTTPESMTLSPEPVGEGQYFDNVDELLLKFNKIESIQLALN